VETFRNPPITEAVIDIRTELGSDVTMSTLESLHEKIKAKYPKKKVRRRVEGRIEFTPEGPPLTESKELPQGFAFWSADDKQVVQYRLDGFTFSRLRPYRDWDAVRSEAKPLWDLFVESAKPIQVTRIALRYINSIDIPAKSFLFEEYFTAPLKVPDGIPQTIEEFLYRIVISIPEFDSKAIITQTLQRPISPSVTSILFDLDVFRKVQLSANNPEIWEILFNLREIKNDIFFKSLTEKTKELFR